MAKRRQNRTKKLTIAEFQSYIEGAIEIGGDDWAPSKEQWDSIVNMIMNLKEEEVVVQQAPAPAPAVRSIPAARGSAMGPEQGPPAVDGDYDRLPPRQGPAAGAMPEGMNSASMQKDPGTGIVSSGVTVKTGVTEAGDFTSKFT